MLFVLEILRVMPALFFNGSAINIYTPLGIVPLTLSVGEIRKIHVPDFHTILTFQHRRRKVSYRLIDLLDSMSVNFAPLPLILSFNIFREIEESDIRATIIGHRGSGRNTFRKENNLPFVPENTVESFRKAFASGAEWVEFDIHKTSDGQIVIFHDYKIGDTPIWNMTLPQFKKLAPYHTTFGQTLSELDSRIKILVEFKYPSVEEVSDGKLGSAPNIEIFVKTALKIIHKNIHARMMRIMSFEPEILLRLREADEDLELYFLTEGIPDKYTDHRRNSFGEGIQFCAENDLQGIVTDTDTINSDPIELTAAAHDAGLQLLVYWWRSLLNGNNKMVSEIMNLDCADVDGLITDSVPITRTIMRNMKTCEWTKRRGKLTKSNSPYQVRSIAQNISMSQQLRYLPTE